MERLGELVRRIGMLRHRDQIAKRLDEEMQLHLELRRQQQWRPRSSRPMTRTPRRVAASAIRRACKRAAATRLGDGTGSKASLQDVSYGTARHAAQPGSPSSRCSRSPSASARIPRSSACWMPSCCALAGKGSRSACLARQRKRRRHQRRASSGHRALLLSVLPASCSRRTQVFSDVAAIFSMTNDVHGFVSVGTEPNPSR